MELFGRISALLPKQYQDQGYELTEDKDFLYLYNRDRDLLKVFHVKTVSITKITQFIDAHRLETELWK